VGVRNVNRLKTAAFSAVAMVGFPFLGVLALVEANRREVSGWTSADGPKPLLILGFLAPAVLTAITTLLGRVRLRTSMLLVVGTLAASLIAIYVLLAIASADGSLS
jgi:hypothetical protein